MKTSDFDYTLPSELIAQMPIEPRDQSRLMVLNRKNSSIEHRRFFELTDFLQPGDILLLNDSRVIPARLKGTKVGTGGKVEILLLRRLGNHVWETLVKPGKRVSTSTVVEIEYNSGVGEGRGGKVLAEIKAIGQGGIKLMTFSDEALLFKMGQIPLPPYIHTPLTKPERYQTVYAKETGSVAAPTAGLHFTPELMKDIEGIGIQCLFITLHIGLDTFRPVREEDPRKHPVYREYGIINSEVAAKISRAKKEGRRIICVGTTTVRLVEQAAQNSEGTLLEPFADWTNLLIFPGHQFRVVDALITNFHLPRSTLMMLVTALTGKDLINHAYTEAVAKRYRFYSFGDAMLIT